MSKTDNTEFEELTINSVAGLKEFLRNAQAQYNLGLDQEASDSSSTNQDLGDALQHAFQTVRHTTNKLIATVEDGGTVHAVDAARLQADYDELVRVVTELLKTATKEVTPRPQPSAKPQPKTPPPKKLKKKPDTNPLASKAARSRTQADPKVSPKTGALKVASEDEQVIDVKDRLKVAPRANSIQPGKKTTKDTSPVEPPIHLTKKEVAKIKLVVDKSSKRIEKLRKQFGNPNMIQDLLFDEAKEGIEHLELIVKKPQIKKEQLLAVSEVAAHIKHALDSIPGAVEQNETPAPKTVPVQTEQLSSEPVSPQKPVSFVPTSITTKKTSVAARSIPAPLQSLPKADDIYELESLTEKYLTAPDQVDFLQQNYSSPAGFEQILDSTITQIEAETIDSIERWLGDLPASAFSFVKDMSVTEFNAFADRPYEAVTYDLQQQNIKYETFTAWRDLVPEMQVQLPDAGDMKVGELFAHWMLAIAMANQE